MITKQPKKTYTFGVRVPHKLARRIRGIAAVYGATPADLTREMLEAIFSGDQKAALDFLGRLQAAIVAHANKQVRVSGPEGGLWTAPALDEGKQKAAR